MRTDGGRKQIARVLVENAGGQVLDYRIPAAMQDSLQPATRVTVPLGRSRRSGYVLERVAESDCAHLREIEGADPAGPMMSAAVLRLVDWLADYYCASREEALQTVLPSPVRRQREKLQLCVFPAEPAPLPGLHTALTDKQAVAWRVVQERPGLPLAQAVAETGTTAAPFRALEARGLVRIQAAAIARDPLAGRDLLPTRPLALSPAQAAALGMIVEESDRAQAERAGPAPTARKASHTVLLYGVTGSGKTEVYLQAIDHVLQRGQGAIVLVPEISLTPQTVERFAARFGQRVAVLHSHLSEGERYDEWFRLKRGDADIVVGARSALFAPVRNLGLIVVDEEHEPSYKQEEAPRYHARDVAVMRGVIEGCTVVLGSATPSLESWTNSRAGKYRLAVLPERADNRTMPVMRVVDMRMERGDQGQSRIFSKHLLDEIGLRMQRSEQVMLFLNRRGHSTTLQCPACGHTATCEFCSVSMTYHRTDERIRCHMCGADATPPVRCPACDDPAFRYGGVGTQRVEQVLARCFPHVAIDRMDADTTQRKGAYEEKLNRFRAGKTRILLGTQMIAKGLHFPNVTLVGVIHADLSLNLPDFRAGERTFQLLAQVAGRAGRGEVPGEVVVQTLTPHHPAVQAARRLDYEGFCDQEMAYRQELSYPPAAHLVCLGFRGASENRVAYVAGTVAQKLADALGDAARVAEASPAPIARIKGLYRYQVILRGRSMLRMAQAIRRLRQELAMPGDVRFTIDVDAINLM